MLILVFGLAQFVFQAPAGYLFDYSCDKVSWLSAAAVSTTCLTLVTAAFAKPRGHNFTLMAIIRILQGAATSLFLPGLNSITQGVVGVAGMTEQVARNEMMNHLGTVFIALSSSVLAVCLYPDLGLLFAVSPVACVGLLFFLYRLDPDWINHDEARGLILIQRPTESENVNDYKEYEPPVLEQEKLEIDAMDAMEKSKKEVHGKSFQHKPLWNFGWLDGSSLNVVSPLGDGSTTIHLNSPWHVLCDPVLLVFILIIFLYCLTNTTVLPLVMQTLAVGSGADGMLLAGMCMVVSQTAMAVSSNLCGKYSASWGRKPLFLIGLVAPPVRCSLLAVLLKIRGENDYESNFGILNILILSTQVIAGVGVGVFGTMYVLVTSDISGGTGRFSMTLGLTTAAISIGNTVSGYVGETLAEDLGYTNVFCLLSAFAWLPPLLYLVAMPETLPQILQTEPTKEYDIPTQKFEDEKGKTQDERSDPNANHLKF